MRHLYVVLSLSVLTACGGSGGRSTATGGDGPAGPMSQATPEPSPQAITYHYRDPRDIRGAKPIDPLAEHPVSWPSHPVGGLRDGGLLSIVITWSSAIDPLGKNIVIDRHGLQRSERRFGRLERYYLTAGDARRIYDRLVAEPLIEAVHIERPAQDQEDG